jgi:anti-sigma regulatory factor (Ser/Thr protein kinase)
MSSHRPAHAVVVRLGGGRRSPGHARAAVLAHVRDVTASARTDELALMTSEVVANAVVHGGAVDGRGIELRMERRDGALRVRVSDPGEGRMPEVRGRDDLEPGGLGLVLLEALSERWGVVRRAGVKEVWFDFELAPPGGGDHDGSHVACSACGLRLYTLEAWVTWDHCPRCDAPLTRVSPTAVS